MPATNLGRTGSYDKIALTPGLVTAAEACIVVDANGNPVHGGGPVKGSFLGASGATDAPVTSTGNSTAAVYAQVPSGKVWRIHRLKAVIVDAASGGGPLTFGAQSAPAADEGVRVRTVASDGSTTLGTLIGSAFANAVLVAMMGDTQANASYGASITTVCPIWDFAEPVVLTAGQRFEVKHLAAVNYTSGYWAVEYSEATA